ncbi:sigma-70 family RNA polymerase sigma factor [Chryseolinea sp. H1M3-3]|uniref:RNA polymerase sigma factor n=1 Tax=Chryseolinea sp. H1M3-3 TaxID=3034144 RepID=UPI0023EC6B11|nr:sigma-70 family RNA polymerase sigma factor [Chryseolinea sp. H1M3-3]
MIQQKDNRQEESHAEDFLIKRSQADPEAFRPLYQKYFKRIFLFVLHRVGDKSLSADITSQVFLKALLHIKRFTFRGLPFSAWLFRIALNECNDYFRKNNRYRLVTIEDVSVQHLYEELTNDSHLDDLHERLPDILQKLTQEELQIIELRFFEQRPFKEVADIIGITETYAKVKVYRILEKMKKLFLKKK